MDRRFISTAVHHLHSCILQFFKIGVLQLQVKKNGTNLIGLKVDDISCDMFIIALFETDFRERIVL